MPAVTSDLDYSREKGATAMIVALCLILLMGMAAIAVDFGAATNERRQDQSAADVGSLAAAQFAKLTTGVGACAGFTGEELARCNGAQVAMAVVNATLDSPGAAAWNLPAECVGMPMGYTASPITQCVAFNQNLQRAWVRVPDIEVPTAFGRVLGVATINTSADAIAITSLARPNNLLPFLTPAISGGGNYECLKTSGNPDWGVCQDTPSTGNFGSADYFIYGNELDGSTERCSGDTNGRLVYNIARGVDHPLSTHPSGTGSGIHETSSCPIFSAEPNMLTGQPGVGSNLDVGLTQGGTANSVAPYDGRIEDAGGVTVRNAGGGNPATVLDDTPLWDFLAPGECPGVDTPSEMEACINSAKASNRIIFTEAIGEAKRFGFTALMWESNFLTPGSDYHVESFLPVYLDTTYYQCNNSGCTVLHTPGVANSGACPGTPQQISCGLPGGHMINLHAVTSYVLAPEILPESVRTPYPGSLNQRQFSLAQ